MNILILASGGIDSTALIPYYKKLDYNIELLWIDYSQKSSKLEEVAIDKISTFFKLNLIKAKISELKPILNKFEYQGRNLFLISTALLFFPFASGLIAIGIRENYDYKDCSPNFINGIKNMVINQTGGIIDVDFPLFSINKAETIKILLNDGFPIELCYSCDQGTSPVCNHCPSCMEVNGALKELHIN